METMNMSQNPEEMKKKLDELQEQARELRKQMPRKAKKQTLPKSMPEEEFLKLISGMKKDDANREYKTAFILAFHSGLRLSEVTNLRQEDIDVAANRIYVKQGKYSKDRVVPLPKVWRNSMMKYIPIKKSKRTLQRQFRSAAKKAGLKSDYTFHSLRHSFATLCLQRGMPINQLQLFLGHATVHTTNVYIRANPEEALNTYMEKF